MKLYHGTSETAVADILKRGLVPRSQTKHKGNWDSSPSHEGMVYLTDAYAGYFAFCSTSSNDERWAIVEVDVDRLNEANLLPDEDFVEQASRGMRWDVEMEEEFRPLWGKVGVKERTRWIRDNLRLFDHLTTKSLLGLGSIAHEGTIGVEHITRITLYTPKAAPSITMTALDPQISIYNYMACCDRYRQLTLWMAMREYNLNALIPPYTLLTREMAAQATEFARLLEQRAGLHAHYEA